MTCCEKCEGKGTLEEDCKNCYGRGVVYLGDVCDVCMGVGVVKCEDCDGRGVLDEPDDINEDFLDFDH